VLLTAGGAAWLLSAQTSARILWTAAAALGLAVSVLSTV